MLEYYFQECVNKMVVLFTLNALKLIGDDRPYLLLLGNVK